MCVVLAWIVERRNGDWELVKRLCEGWVDCTHCIEIVCACFCADVGYGLCADRLIVDTKEQNPSDPPRLIMSHSDIPIRIVRQ
jgi:hypothetical protein